jgi:hypothetical protein
MPVMQASTQVYNFSLDEIKKLVAADLTVSPDHITVEYVQTEISDAMDRYSRKEVTSVKVTVDTKKSEAAKSKIRSQFSDYPGR